MLEIYRNYNMTNFVYLSIDFNEHFQQENVNVIYIGKELIKHNLYIELTDTDLEEAKKEELYADVRFIYARNRQIPSSVILVRDGEECKEGSEEDEYVLDDLILMYYEEDKNLLVIE